MSQRLLIDHSENGTRTALMDGGKLKEIYIDQNTNTSWVGRVIVGRIKTILPGQFAFVDIGSSKNAFMNLHTGHGLKAGMPILVQVQKDANRQKGAYVSLEIDLKGRLVVLSENSRNEVGVSRKITDERESRRLKKLVRKHIPTGYSAIVRTNAEGQDEPTITEEIHTLYQLHQKIKKRAQFALPATVLYPDASENTLLNDLLSEALTEIQISGTESIFQETKATIIQIIPSLANRIHHHTGEQNLFSVSGINKQIKLALEKTVHLPCGGTCTFEETEACVVIDVNTGSNVGQTNYRETVLQTNLEAAKCIARQLTLRNLSGIIIIDFIDMPSSQDEAALTESFANALSQERTKPEIIGMIGLGMMQLTRRKTRPSLSQVMEINCPHCGGKGRVKRD